MDIPGLVIFVGIVGMYAALLTGCLERRLKRLDRIVKQIENDTKYVN